MNRPALSLLALTLFAGCAHAQPDDSRWTRKALRSSCDFWGNCTYHYHPMRPRVSYEAPRVYAFRAFDEPRCRDRRTAVGEEKQGRDRAEEEATKKWSSTVRFEIGARYMDLTNAEDITYECVQSSTGERFSEKLASATTGAVLMQCQIRAIPCRAKKEHGDDKGR